MANPTGLADTHSETRCHFLSEKTWGCAKVPCGTEHSIKYARSSLHCGLSTHFRSSPKACMLSSFVIPLPSKAPPPTSCSNTFQTSTKDALALLLL